MEMLYRLSYVGAHDRDHPSGRRGSDAERKERWTGRCGRAGEARVCVEKTHHPEGDLSDEGRLGVSRETGNLGSVARIVNANLEKIRVCAGRPDHWVGCDRDDNEPGEYYLPERFTVRSMERETGFEPATLGLEGRCSSR